jgi:hypothetical protein
MDGLARTRRPLQNLPRLITDAYHSIGETEWLPPFKAYMNSFERSAFATLLWALASAGYCRRRRFPYCRCATSRTGLWPLALGCKYRAANETRQGHSFAVLFLHRPAPPPIAISHKPTPSRNIEDQDTDRWPCAFYRVLPFGVSPATIRYGAAKYHKRRLSTHQSNRLDLPPHTTKGSLRSTQSIRSTERFSLKTSGTMRRARQRERKRTCLKSFWYCTTIRSAVIQPAIPENSAQVGGSGIEL